MDEDKLVEEISDEIDNLHRTWQIFADEMKNGNNSHLHCPPALVLAAARIFEGYTNGTIDFNDIDNPCVSDLRTIINYGSQMFEFGQKAARIGVLSANMTPCKCLEVSDEEIAKLIGEANE